MGRWNRIGLDLPHGGWKDVSLCVSCDMGNEERKKLTELFRTGGI